MVWGLENLVNISQNIADARPASIERVAGGGIGL